MFVFYCRMAETNHCNFFLEKKNRFCRMLTKDGSDYCGEHQTFAPTELQEVADQFARMVCPLDSSHTCYVRHLKKHLRKCNANKKDPVYITHGLNRGSSTNDEIHGSTLCTIDDLALVQLISKIETVCTGIIPSVTERSSVHPRLQKEIETQANGVNSKRQLSQVSSLLSLIEKFNSIHADTCFLEFGAGRGMLTYWLGEITAEVPQSSFLLIERSAYRHKFDGRLSTKRDCVVRRVKADIGDLNLDEIELLKEHQHLVALSKHLCGAATDMALRCMTMTCEDISMKFRSIFIATCCHHRCDISSYVAMDYLVELGFEISDFNVMCGITSWATCGSRKNELIRKPENSVDRYARLQLTHEKRRKIGRMCKLIFDYGRIKFLEKYGYNGVLTYYVPESVSPENVCLIAIKN
ncbi:tRNA:m(4)X modification enzyme TRM13 homolog isoform X1 [Schistocerca serialis cubense]|uniref:tRNA:m(4)X modification enzyme TRM13 homolog isoform X1 n=2 Tax=Schistocerca serialis cubense TaxID=2023355 RepID=UPI00214EB9FB|nr:tRNA:m(4)X modification enzyme TRM13 homolog isoform X1 [Schistocerca serialis cubense]XP_049954413.1 tRNA:m(4)X modification enzyme TRM13 homolog isoform X1 [Schistocerca serialis cubense]